MRRLRSLAAIAACAIGAGPASTLAAGPWSVIAPSPTPRLEGAAAVVDGRLYAFGGFGPGLGAQTAVHAYDPDTDTWSVRASMLRAVTHAQAAVVGRRVYVAGGFEGSNPGAVIADVQVYDVDLDAWSNTAVPDLPAARASGALVAHGTRIHYLGGVLADRCTDTSDHLVLDTANPGAGWSARAPLPRARNHFNGVAVAGAIYTVGGQVGHDCGITYVTDVERYDPATNAWTPRAALPSPRSHHEPSIFAWNGFVVVGGGTDAANPALATVVAYEIARDRWLAWPDLPAARRSPILQRIGGRLLFGTGGALPSGIDVRADMQLDRVRADAPRVLFVRGADRSGGFLEATTDAQRTEQLADIDNTATTPGNHGWGALRATLQSEGFLPEQVTETADTPAGPSAGIAVPLENAGLEAYAAVVLGSNNAAYAAASVDALENFVRAGGGALFISDANFGSDWSDAPSSDQPFLDRFGLVMNQDHGTYTVDAAEFVVPAHPVLQGVSTFDGEGVSPIVLGAPTAGVNATVIAAAEGQTRVNTPPFGAQNQGALRAVTPADAATLVATADAGRIAGHFDRNTFFNANGAGTDITRLANRTYAINLFDWLAQGAPPPLFADGFESH